MGLFTYKEVDELLRGKGIGKALIAKVLKMFAEAGWRYTFCHIPPKNTTSIRAVESCGFRKMELVRFVEMVGFKWKSKKIEDFLVRGIGD